MTSWIANVSILSNCQKLSFRWDWFNKSYLREFARASGDHAKGSSTYRISSISWTRCRASNDVCGFIAKTSSQCLIKFFSSRFLTLNDSNRNLVVFSSRLTCAHLVLYIDKNSCLRDSDIGKSMADYLWLILLLHVMIHCSVCCQFVSDLDQCCVEICESKCFALTFMTLDFSLQRPCLWTERGRRNVTKVSTELILWSGSHDIIFIVHAIIDVSTFKDVTSNKNALTSWGKVVLHLSRKCLLNQQPTIYLTPVKWRKIIRSRFFFSPEIATPQDISNIPF